MADVLLVYVRDDEVFAEGVGRSLERSGLTVARGESVFDVGDDAPCVLIMWSRSSTRSAMVRDVAIRAQREGKLVAARLAGCETPLGFARPAPHDLSQWNGDPDDPILDPMFFAADRLVCAARLVSRGPEAAPPLATTPTPLRAIRGGQSAAPAYQAQPRPARVEPASAPDPSLAPRRSLARGAAPDPATAATPAPNLPPNVAEEALAWKRIEQSKDAKDFLDYLNQYGPHGIFCELAQMKLDKLAPQQKSKPGAGSFMPHHAAPHAPAAKAKAAPPRAVPPPEARPPREPPRPPTAEWRERNESARADPEWREPEAEWRDPGRDSGLEPPARSTARPVSRTRPQEWREGDVEFEAARPPPARSATGRPRRRVEPVRGDVRRPERIERGGMPWRPLMIVALLAVGGVVFVQTLPKQAAPGAQDTPPEFSDAQRAGPIDSNGVTLGAETAPPPVDATSQTATPVPAAKQLAMMAPPTRAQQAAAQAAKQKREREQQQQRAAAPAAPSAAPVVNFRPPESAAPAEAASTLATTASTIAPAPASDGYVQPIWLKKPTGSSLADVYPTRALKNNLAGAATLDCMILTGGRLACSVASESPANQGFGPAAARAAAAFVAAPKSVEGVDAYGKRARVVIRFQTK